MKIIFNQGILDIYLNNGCVIRQSSHPLTNDLISKDNYEVVAKACVSKDEWDDYLKLKGFEFDGVMCSATADDQNGLIAVLTAFQLQGTEFQPTIFRFSNGNTLELTSGNVQSFISAWFPFRQSFFHH